MIMRFIRVCTLVANLIISLRDKVNLKLRKISDQRLSNRGNEGTADKERLHLWCSHNAAEFIKPRKMQSGKQKCIQHFGCSATPEEEPLPLRYRGHPPVPTFLVLRTPSRPNLSGTADTLPSQPFWYCGPPPQNSLIHFD
jgi:hypothetical protein